MTGVVKKIGIVAGSGDVGKRLATGFVKAGYEVKIGTRDANKLKEWSKENPTVTFGSNEEAAKFGDVVLIASGWTGTEAALKQAGAENLKGKVLLDITNPIDVSSGRVKIIEGVNGGKTVQGWAPGAHVVKFLNSVGNALFSFPYSQNGVKPTTFIAGDNEEAKKTATKILNTLGWENVVDAGDISAAPYLEALCPLWVNLAFTNPSLKFSHNWAFLTQ